MNGGRRELESRILILVTLALVAFGIVMVYSATSASAAVGGADPNFYLERQVTYAALGIVLLVIAQHWDYRRLRALAPGLVVVSLFLLVAVLAVAPRRERRAAVDRRRARPCSSRPSSRSSRSRSGPRATSRNGAPPRTLGELAKPFGLLGCLFAGLIVLEPDLGTAIAIVLMLFAMLLVAGTSARLLGLAFAITLAAGIVAIYLEPYRRARFFAFLHPWDDSQGNGFQIVQAHDRDGLRRHLRRRARPGRAEDLLPARGAHRHDAREHRRGARADRRRPACSPRTSLFAYAGFRIALGCRDPFGKRLAAGLTVLVCGQAAVNIWAVDGHRAADRDPAAVPLLRRLEPRGPARLGRDPP